MSALIAKLAARLDGPGFVALALAIEAEALDVERDIAGSILADPARDNCAAGVELAEACGFVPAAMEDESLRLIVATAFAARCFPLVGVLRLARRVLHSCGRWDPTVSERHRGPLWSNESLAALAEAWPGPVAIPRLVVRLRDLRRRQREAAESLARAVEVLEGRDRPKRPMLIVANARPTFKPRRAS